MIHKTYEIQIYSGLINEAYSKQPRATNNNTTSNMQKKQVDTNNLSPHQDEDIDLQLEAITHEHGDSSL